MICEARSLLASFPRSRMYDGHGPCCHMQNVPLDIAMIDGALLCVYERGDRMWGRAGQGDRSGKSHRDLLHTRHAQYCRPSHTSPSTHTIQLSPPPSSTQSPPPALPMTTPAGLQRGPSQPATLLNRAMGLFQAGLILGALYVGGFPHAVWVQLTHPNPLHWLNPVRWRNLIIEAGLPKLLLQGDKDSGHLKRATIESYARGRVFELGAGTGLSVQYYNKTTVDELFLVEPFAKLHAELRENIAKMGEAFAKKTRIVPFGVEERSKLSEVGVKAGTFDTVVLGMSLHRSPATYRPSHAHAVPPRPPVQVLCSIPNREDHLPYIQTLLKPGGQLLLFEHVASDDYLTEWLQRLYNPVWTVLSMGCNVNRHSGNMVKDLGGWKEIDMHVPEGQHGGTLYPRVIARYIKA